MRSEKARNMEQERTLYLYRLSQEVNDNWDTYDVFIVAGYSEDEVRGLHPVYDHDDIAHGIDKVSGYYRNNPHYYHWVLDPQDVKVECVGVAGPNIKPGQVICSSFNAG